MMGHTWSSLLVSASDEELDALEGDLRDNIDMLGRGVLDFYDQEAQDRWESDRALVTAEVARRKQRQL